MGRMKRSSFRFRLESPGISDVKIQAEVQVSRVGFVKRKQDEEPEDETADEDILIASLITD